MHIQPVPQEIMEDQLTPVASTSEHWRSLTRT